MAPKVAGSTPVPHPTNSKKEVHNLKVYRYEVIDNGVHKGFLTAFDDYFDDDTIFELCWFFEHKLPDPDINMKNTTSYFTEKGNRTFNKAIKAAKKEFISRGLDFICIVKEIDENLIIYKDKYQVIISGCSSEG